MKGIPGRAAGGGRDLQHVVGAEVLHRFHRAHDGARRVADLNAQQIGEVEFVLVRLREPVAGDVQLQAA